MAETKSKKVLSVSIDPDLLDKIDIICQLQGDSRSAFIERALRDKVESKEDVLKELEKPLARVIFNAMAKTPEQFILFASKIVGENLTPEDIELVKKHTPLYIEEGKKRQQLKKKGGKKDESSKQ